MFTSVKRGFSFGITSGIITTLGLMVGLNSSTHSRLTVMGGILTIAVADALSDAMGVHMSEESGKNISNRSVWQATGMTFLTKLLMSASFIIPFLIFQVEIAVWASIIYGLIVLSIFSYKLAINHRKKPSQIIIEHVVIVILVIFLTNLIGNYLSKFN